MQFIYLQLQIPCVILELNFKLATPRPDQLDRWFYDIKFQKYYPWLSLSRTSIIDSSLTGQEIASLGNKTVDLSTQIDDLTTQMAPVIDKSLTAAVGDIIDTVSNALDNTNAILDDLRSGIQTPLQVAQAAQQELADASVQVKQAILEVDDIYSTPSQIASTLRDMSVSLDFLASTPWVSTTMVLTVVTEDGDTLEDLSDNFYGSFENWRVILNANAALIPDPDNLAIGITLSIPQ